MLRDFRAGRSVALHDVDDACGQASLEAQLREQQRRQRREFGGLQHDGVTRRQRRRNFPRKHQEGEIPRDNLTDNAAGFIGREFGFKDLRPACMVIEMARGQRHVDIARFADRLAVIKAFDNRQQARIFLDQAGKGVEVFRTVMTVQCRP